MCSYFYKTSLTIKYTFSLISMYTAGKQLRTSYGELQKENEQLREIEGHIKDLQVLLQLGMIHVHVYIIIYMYMIVYLHVICGFL